MSGVTNTQRSQPLESGRQVQVGVGEQGKAAEHDLEGRHHHRRDAEQQHGGDLDPHRQQDLQRVEAHARTDIEAEVGVVHPMQPPQPADPMHQPMLRVDQQVQRHEADHRRRPGRHARLMQQAEIMRPRPQRGVHRQPRQQQAQAQRIDQAQPEIHRPALPPSRLLDVPRPAPFGETEQGQQGEEQRESELGVLHGVRRVLGTPGMVVATQYPPFTRAPARTSGRCG